MLLGTILAACGARRPLVQPALAADNWGGGTLGALLGAASYKQAEGKAKKNSDFEV